MIERTDSVEAIITALSAGVTATTIFSVVGDLVPWLIILIPASLGLYELRKVVKGSAKGKVRF